MNCARIGSNNRPETGAIGIALQVGGGGGRNADFLGCPHMSAIPLTLVHNFFEVCYPLPPLLAQRTAKASTVTRARRTTDGCRSPASPPLPALPPSAAEVAHERSTSTKRTVREADVVALIGRMKAGKGGKAGGNGATATVTHYRAGVRRGSILNFCDPLPPPMSRSGKSGFSFRGWVDGGKHEDR